MIVGDFSEQGNVMVTGIVQLVQQTKECAATVCLYTSKTPRVPVKKAGTLNSYRTFIITILKK